MFGIVGHIHFHPALIKYVTDYRIQVLLYIAVHSGVSVQQDGRASPFQYDKSLITVKAFHMNIRNQSVKFRFLSTLMVGHDDGYLLTQLLEYHIGTDSPDTWLVRTIVYFDFETVVCTDRLKKFHCYIITDFSCYFYLHAYSVQVCRCHS